MKRTIALLFLIAVSRVSSAAEILNCDDHMDDDLISLACNMFWEANTQGEDGMIAVAAVTLARVQSDEYPDTIAGVVWEKRWSKRYQRHIPQFSWTLDGKRDAPTIYGQKTWKKALLLARQFAIPAAHKAAICPQIDATKRMWDYLEGEGVPVSRRDITCPAYETIMLSKLGMIADRTPVAGALYYHADYVDPSWAKRLIARGYETVQVKTHIFYREEDAVGSF